MYKIIDNVLPKEMFEEVSERILKNDFAWYYCPKDSTNENTDVSKVSNNTILTSQLIHILYCDEGVENSIFTKPFKKVIDYILEKNNIEGKIYRAKLNMLFNNFKLKDEVKHNGIHIDDPTDPKKHLSLILYLNESDGDTVLFKQGYNDNTENLTILKRVSPKPNRLLIFNNHFHASTNPIKYEKRIVLNIVIK